MGSGSDAPCLRSSSSWSSTDIAAPTERDPRKLHPPRPGYKLAAHRPARVAVPPRRPCRPTPVPDPRDHRPCPPPLRTRATRARCSTMKAPMKAPMKTPSHPWSFRQRLRARAFGWRGSSLAIQRLKEALAEIEAANRSAPALAAEGAVLLMERLWPALQAVDSSSGSLGNAVGKTVHALIDILLAAPADEPTLERWLERLWTAMEEDGVDFLSEVGERWGELCRTAPRAGRVADGLITTVRLSWSPEHKGYFRGTFACLSCLLAAGRHQDLLALLATAPYLSWHYRRYGVLALAADGRPDEAIAYAEASRGRNDSPAAIARTCEEVLLAAGRPDEAYRRYASLANRAGSHLATFRAINKEVPGLGPAGLCLVRRTPASLPARPTDRPDGRPGSRLPPPAARQDRHPRPRGGLHPPGAGRRRHPLAGAAGAAIPPGRSPDPAAARDHVPRSGLCGLRPPRLAGDPAAGRGRAGGPAPGGGAGRGRGPGPAGGRARLGRAAGATGVAATRLTPDGAFVMRLPTLRVAPFLLLWGSAAMAEPCFCLH